VSSVLWFLSSFASFSFGGQLHQLKLLYDDDDDDDDGGGGGDDVKTGATLRTGQGMRRAVIAQSV
jgi:hypothetical protein